MRRVTVLSCLLAAVLSPACSREESPPAGSTRTDVERPTAEAGEEYSDRTDDATSPLTFEDVDRWAKVFENPSRAEWQKPEVLVGALAIERGMTVADIGAGTGYLNRFLASAVGPDGRVHAVDVEPEMVAYMTARAEREGTPNVIASECRPDDPGLPDNAIDRILLVNTYHYIDDRLDYFDRLRRTLKPGGTVAVVEFKKERLPVGPPTHAKLARDRVTGEMETAGYRLVDEPDVLPYHYFLIFEAR